MTTAASGRRSTRPRNRMTASERMSQILTAATSLIAERGFWGLTIRDVADACGITEAGLLHHVGSKDGLLVAVLENRDEVDMTDLGGRLNVPVGSIFALADPLEVGLRALCEAIVARNARQPEIVRLYAVLQGESLNREHPAYTYFVDRERWAMTLFTRAAETDGLRDPRRIAREVFAAMDGLQLRWLRQPAEIDLVSAWDALADKILSQQA